MIASWRTTPAFFVFMVMGLIFTTGTTGVFAAGSYADEAVTAQPDARLRFEALEPCAVFDTRDASGGLAGRNDGGDILTFEVASDGPVAAGQGAETCVAPPSDAVAVELNLVAVLPAHPGNLKVAAAGTVADGGVVNFAPGGNNSSSVPVAVDGSGRVDVEVNSLSPGATFVRGVAMGYYVPADASSESLVMVPVTPCAVFDTRTTAAGPLGAGESRTFDVAGGFDQSAQGGEECGAPPAGTAAAVINLVAVHPTSNGNLKIVAAGGVANGGVVNFRTGGNNSNAVPVGLSDDGKVTVSVNANDAGRGAHVRGVVLGYYVTPEHPNADLGHDLVVTTACAVFDTRSAIGALAGRTDHLETRTFAVASDTALPDAQGGADCVSPPAEATAAVVNLVAIGPVAPGNLQAAPAGIVPNGGVVNFEPAIGTNSNAIITGLADGQLDVVTKAAGNHAVHLRGVTLGWYRPATVTTVEVILEVDGEQTMNVYSLDGTLLDADAPVSHLAGPPLVQVRDYNELAVVSVKRRGDPDSSAVVIADYSDEIPENALYVDSSVTVAPSGAAIVSQVEWRGAPDDPDEEYSIADLHEVDEGLAVTLTTEVDRCASVSCGISGGWSSDSGYFSFSTSRTSEDNYVAKTFTSATRQVKTEFARNEAMAIRYIEEESIFSFGRPGGTWSVYDVESEVSTQVGNSEFTGVAGSWEFLPDRDVLVGTCSQNGELPENIQDACRFPLGDPAGNRRIADLPGDVHLLEDLSDDGALAIFSGYEDGGQSGFLVDVEDEFHTRIYSGLRDVLEVRLVSG